MPGEPDHISDIASPIGCEHLKAGCGPWTEPFAEPIAWLVRSIVILSPEGVPLNGSVLGTAKGTWVIHVDEAVRVEGTATVLLNLTLERGTRKVDDATLMRRLGLLLPAVVLKEFRLRESVACDIRSWLESTEGNGFLDLRATYLQAM